MVRHTMEFMISLSCDSSQYCLMTPSNEEEMQLMLNTGLNYNGISTVRYPRGNTNGNKKISCEDKLTIGKSKIINEAKILLFLFLAFAK